MALRAFAPALASVALAFVAFLVPAACGVKAPPTPVLEGFEPRYAAEVNRRRAEATPTATPTTTAGPPQGSAPGASPGSPAGVRPGNGTKGTPAAAPREWNDPGPWPTPGTESPSASETFAEPPGGPKPTPR